MGALMTTTTTRSRAPETLSSHDYREKEWQSSGTSRSDASPLRIPEYLRPVVEQLANLLALRSGWNSYGAKRIDPDAATRALLFLVEAGWDGPLPSVSPTPQGGVQFEWGGQDDGLELRFAADGAVSVLIDVNGTMREQEARGGLGGPILWDALDWAYKLA
jgi:hypothetical protein